MTQITSLRTVDTRMHPLFFSSFDVKDCWDEMGPVVTTNLRLTIQQCTKPDTQERRKALYMHENPHGNLFTLTLGLCEAERVGSIVRILQFLCIIDDVLEVLPHGDALVEHDILCDGLRGFSNACTPNTRPEWIKFLQDVKAEVIAVDPIRGPALFLTFEESLRIRDSSDVEFEAIKQYLPYRLINFDYELVANLILWAMDVDLSPEEADSELLHDFKYSIGVIVGLINDYYSWEREKRQQQDSDRIRNGVAVLMKQHNLSDQDAKAAVKKMIIEEELKIHTMLENPQLEISTALKRFLDGLRMFAGGYSFWCATCPRYQKPEGDSD
ncbi:hypothetical protein E1B28_007996 [Marasmius oreades]|uniref:Terpenoid synthase n=1 Tax=Marasmius oreades TaxID=181124 RepID=A0A9P7UVI3_9AGAR|nr:uncharacterized protein E1B28_007996 [Marasmius oreades]KAG7094396.1 hypothetical protein E1B28_007996 [Marasmius oreades]